jgi:outer membrane protein assembly factor BamB
MKRILILLACISLLVPAMAQWKYDVTLTGYPGAQWKALTSYVDKPTAGDVNGDGALELIGASVFGDVFCVSGKTGQILWTYEDEHSFDLAIYICPALVDLDGDKILDILTVTPGGMVLALDGQTGRKKWGFQCASATGFSPVVFTLGNRPAITVTDLGGRLYLLDAQGTVVWKKEGDSPLQGTPSVAVAGDSPAIVVAGRDGSLRCFGAADGHPLWRFAPSKAGNVTSHIAFKMTARPSGSAGVLAGTDRGGVYLLDAESGKEIWARSTPNEAVGDFSVGDLTGSGGQELVYATSGSRVIAARVSDGREVWSRKLKLPVKEYAAPDGRRKIARDVLAGQAVLADGDGDGRLDAIMDIRGLSSTVVCLRGSDGVVVWQYGTTALFRNPAIAQSAVISAYQESAPLNSFSSTVPVFSQPTPLVGDLDGDGRLDLIVNDRDEVGLVSVPLKSPASGAVWPKYRANATNAPGMP